MCSLFSVFKMSTNGRKFRFSCYIFDTCDVVYNWSISPLPPIVLDNLFGKMMSGVHETRSKERIQREQWIQNK